MTFSGGYRVCVSYSDLKSAAILIMLHHRRDGASRAFNTFSFREINNRSIRVLEM
jgi:hypothetical protein